MKVFDIDGNKLTRTEVEKSLYKKLTNLSIGEELNLIIKRVG